MKKTATTSPSNPGARRGRNRAIQYLLLFVGAVLLVDALVGDKGFAAMLKAREDYQRLENALAHSRDENTRLREEARSLREDPEAIEAIARRDLGLIRPGEKLFIVKDAKPR